MSKENVLEHCECPHCVKQRVEGLEAEVVRLQQDKVDGIKRRLGRLLKAIQDRVVKQCRLVDYDAAEYLHRCYPRDGWRLFEVREETGERTEMLAGTPWVFDKGDTFHWQITPLEEVKSPLMTRVEQLERDLKHMVRRCADTKARAEQFKSESKDDFDRGGYEAVGVSADMVGGYMSAILVGTYSTGIAVKDDGLPLRFTDTAKENQRLTEENLKLSKKVERQGDQIVELEELCECNNDEVRDLESEVKRHEEQNATLRQEVIVLRGFTKESGERMRVLIAARDRAEKAHDDLQRQLKDKDVGGDVLVERRRGNELSQQVVSLKETLERSHGLLAAQRATSRQLSGQLKLAEEANVMLATENQELRAAWKKAGNDMLLCRIELTTALNTVDMLEKDNGRLAGENRLLRADYCALDGRLREKWNKYQLLGEENRALSAALAELQGTLNTTRARAAADRGRRCGALVNYALCNPEAKAWAVDSGDAAELSAMAREGWLLFEYIPGMHPKEIPHGGFIDVTDDQTRWIVVAQGSKFARWVADGCKIPHFS